MIGTVKNRKYEKLCRDLKRNTGKQVHLCAFEISQLVYVASSTIELLKLLKLPKSAINKVTLELSKEALVCSKMMFDYRDSDTWPYPLS
jgi:hypothetical protein